MCDCFFVLVFIFSLMFLNNGILEFRYLALGVSLCFSSKILWKVVTHIQAFAHFTTLLILDGIQRNHPTHQQRRYHIQLHSFGPMICRWPLSLLYIFSWSLLIRTYLNNSSPATSGLTFKPKHLEHAFICSLPSSRNGEHRNSIVVWFPGSLEFRTIYPQIFSPPHLPSILSNPFHLSSDLNDMSVLGL